MASYVRRRMNIDGRQKRGFGRIGSMKYQDLTESYGCSEGFFPPGSSGEFKGGSRNSTEGKSSRPKVQQRTLRVAARAWTSTVR